MNAYSIFVFLLFSLSPSLSPVPSFFPPLLPFFLPLFLSPSFPCFCLSFPSPLSSLPSFPSLPFILFFLFSYRKFSSPLGLNIIRLKMMESLNLWLRKQIPINQMNLNFALQISCKHTFHDNNLYFKVHEFYWQNPQLCHDKIILQNFMANSKIKNSDFKYYHFCVCKFNSCISSEIIL